MSLNRLVGGDCGGNNSLVQLSNIVRRDGTLPQQSQTDMFVHEFMSQNSQVPQTFNMKSLLNNLPANANMATSSAAPASTSANIANVSTMNRVWGPGLGPGPSFLPHQPLMPGRFMPTQPNAHAPYHAAIHPEIEYVDEVDVAAKAQEYVDTVKADDEQAYNEFMAFMKKISAGELNLGEVVDEEKQMSKDELINEMNEKFKSEWEKLSPGENYWETTQMYDEYQFTEGNVMLENKSALELGKERLKMGDIPGAALCFEAACQQAPESHEAWYLLGTTQAENEQDPQAISALRKSLKINPTQLEAYITLAASYTNENMSKYAYFTLLDWLKANPKYNDTYPKDVDPKDFDVGRLENYCKSLYLKAVQLNPSHIDPDVQNALGVVYSITQEYDKAADCFKTALMVDPENAKIWNRLGATLANSDRSEEAVDAYQNALKLEPGFIRARYNVGITCMNLNAHREAAEHFLEALNHQHKANAMFEDLSTNDISSSTIWMTLRMVCSFLGEHEVAQLVDERKLAELNKFFGVSN